jgi:hypothetical protein
MNIIKSKSSAENTLKSLRTIITTTNSQANSYEASHVLMKISFRFPGVLCVEVSGKQVTQVSWMSVTRGQHPGVLSVVSSRRWRRGVREGCNVSSVRDAGRVPGGTTMPKPLPGFLNVVDDKSLWRFSKKFEILIRLHAVIIHICLKKRN